MEINNTLGFDLQKEAVRLERLLTSGEITEDEMNEQLNEYRKIIKNRKSKKRLEEIHDEEEMNEEPEDGKYGKYFQNHKKEFRNILGL